MGYGMFWWNKRKGLAHRFAYETFIGPIPEGLEIDHKCRNPSCVNPAHLQTVSHKTNIILGVVGEVNAARQRSITHCPRGHPYNEVNTYISPRGGRNCRMCRRESQSRYRQNKRKEE